MLWMFLDGIIQTVNLVLLVLDYAEHLLVIEATLE